ncbi:FUSC family protein [Streptomyces sp. ST2-7A]|uniref:FUSC family protein n=1 Tax=Streptomyces sp. ST2-7A TaxID=2907214 RepID=UPI001F19CE20|nr:FUSC family protein [Streptomyces sp. ST2-7A]MCE7080993.1 FUSC family protein [Streptomyces sp. ST2-7A]
MASRRIPLPRSLLARVPRPDRTLRAAGPVRPVRRVGLAFARLRRYLPAVLLAGLAAGLAFAIAAALFGAEAAFFAPIAAVVCVGIAAGQRVRRAVEIAVGVALGLTAADLLVNLIGSGPVQLGAAVVLAMTAAVLLGTGSVLVNQSAVAAVLVIALAPQGDNNPLIRLADALIGGGVGVLLASVLGPNPGRVVERAGVAVLDHLIEVVCGIGEALARVDLERAERTLTEAGRIEDRMADLDRALETARESARLGNRRRSLHPRSPMPLLRSRLELTAATVRAMARAAANAVRHGRPVDARLVTAVEDLAVALGELRRWAQGGNGREEARDAALRAARLASEIPPGGRPLTSGVLIGQIRSAAIDILRSTGLDQREAVRTLERRAGRADTPEDREEGDREE